MKKFLLTMAALATSIVGAQTALAGFGVMPHATTFRKMNAEAGYVVKAKLVSVTETPVTGFNREVAYYRHNNGNEAVRRDAVLEVTKVLRGDVQIGQLTVVSLQQRSFDQYPASMRAGGEAILFLDKRAFDNLIEFRGEARGLLDAESCGGSLDRALTVLNDFEMISTEFGETERPAQVQNRMLSEIALDNSRLSLDVAIDFGWNTSEFAADFSDSEKQQVLALAIASEPGTELRGELITAVGRLKPAGGDAALVNLIASDASFSTASLGSWALEQYGRANSARMLLDRYVTTPQTSTTARARLITALGIMRPKAIGDEVASRQRFTDVLKGALKAGTDASVREEALLAARDMRFTNNELKAELIQAVEDFKTGALTDITVLRRTIVALAATRNAEARTYLLSLKGNFSKRFDKDIDMALLTPFTVLVDGK